MARSSNPLNPRFIDPAELNDIANSSPASSFAGMAIATALPDQASANGTAAPYRSEGNDIVSEAANQSIYLEYILDRRRRLTAVIAPVIALLALVSFIIFSVFLVALGTHPFSLEMIDATIGLTTVALVVATLLARWRRANLAASVTVVSISAAIVLVQLIWILTRGIDPYGLLLFTALDIAIVLLGVLGTERTTIVSTAIFSLITAGLWFFAPRAPGMEQLIDSELILVVPMSILAEWGIAVLQIATLRTSRQTLSQLGSLTMAYERVRQLDELKDEFISSVNHELRTPLMAMLGYLEVLKLSVNRVSSEQMVNLVEQANQAGADLRHLVDSILESRRQDQGSSNFESVAVNIRAALEVAVRMLDSADTQAAPSGRAAQPEPRDLHIAAAPTLEVWGDKTRLQQILVNLLSNAMKYSAPSTPIVVSAYPAPEQVAIALDPLLEGLKGGRRRRARGETRAVKIVVRDYGLGVPPEQAPLLFQRFARLPRDLASNVIGNGLGLWLCQQLTQAMHGRIWVESTGVEGEGSEFHLLLPAPPEER